jgi:hypothetical protein
MDIIPKELLLQLLPLLSTGVKVTLAKRMFDSDIWIELPFERIQIMCDHRNVHQLDYYGLHQLKYRMPLAYFKLNSNASLEYNNEEFTISIKHDLTQRFISIPKQYEVIIDEFIDHLLSKAPNM